MMCVWFEGNVCSAPAGFLAGGFEGNCFGVLDCFEDVEPLANNLACAVNNNTTHQWSRANLSDASRRKLERASHHATVGAGPGKGWVLYSRGCLHLLDRFTQRRQDVKQRRKEEDQVKLCHLCVFATFASLPPLRLCVKHFLIPEQTIDVLLRIKDDQVVDFFAYPGITNR